MIKYFLIKIKLKSLILITLASRLTLIADSSRFKRLKRRLHGVEP